MRRLTPVHIVVIGLLVVTGLGSLVRAKPAVTPRPLSAIDPDRIAALEVDMWQAYYAKQRLRLFSSLVTMLHEQYGFSWVGAATTGFSLAKAAVVFGDATGEYDRALPDLRRAFARIRTQTGAQFDPARVADAELAWWVARRTAGRDSPEQVGALIAELYAALYGRPVDEMLDAGTLRARAAALRDAQAREPDWVTVGTLLQRSYRRLHDRLHGG